MAENNDNDAWKVYQDDARTPCKYGTGCYQKNPHHHSRFKHPPNKRKKEDEEPQPKKPRITLEKIQTKKPRIESEDENSENDYETKISTEDDESGGSSLDNTLDSAAINGESSKKENTQDEEEEELDCSPIDVRENIKQKFLVEMPEDFYDFWSFCTSLKGKPEDALASIGLYLVGPYDILSGKLKSIRNRKLSQYLIHWRYYHDPPEFQTIIAGNDDEYHIGYFRDDPSELPVFAASMSSVKAGTVTPLGGNVFAAVSSYINNKLKTVNPFMKMNLQKIANNIESFAKEKDYSLDSKTSGMKARSKHVVAKSFHGAGIVVPVDKNTEVGYREIPETNANLRRMLKRIVEANNEDDKEKRFDDLHELITNVQFANDEGDPGMGLELGIDLLMFGGKEFHSSIRHLLTVAYELLNREAFGKIIEAHLKNRRTGSKLSIMK